MAQDHQTELQSWHEERMATLRGDAGWLHITDRIPLSPGVQSVGRGPQNEVRLHAGPEVLGEVTLAEDGAVSLTDADGSRDFPQAKGQPAMLRSGDLLLEISRLEGEVALRVRDLSDQTRFAYPALARFEIDPAWDIDAAWEALPEAQAFGIDTVVGVATSVTLTHRARFEHDGAEVVLLATHWRGAQPMFVFRDATSGRETYGAARFLYGELRGDRVRLDFNKAFNPPCSFTDHAVCPLPPQENRLAFPIRAGERAPAPRGQL